MRAVTGPGLSAGRLPILIGLAAWIVACLLPLDGDGVGWVAGRFVLLAALVWMPLALRLVDGPTPPGLPGLPVLGAGLPRLIRELHPFCAALLIGSFLLPAG